jgi:hypothetical protein
LSQVGSFLALASRLRTIPGEVIVVLVAIVILHLGHVALATGVPTAAIVASVLLLALSLLVLGTA